MVALLKRVWHDPVGSKVIAAAILFAGSRLVRYWPQGLLTSVNRWFDTPITFTLTRGDLVNWPLLAASIVIALYTVALGIRIELRKRREPPPAEPQADAQSPGTGDRQKAAPFEPEKFELNGPRSRALLGLLQRVDARTTLDDLYRFVAPPAAPYIDMDTTKAQLQFDMEEAERLGVVSIDRISPLTHCYSLTVPNGRDWTLRNKAKLQAEAPKGMRRRDPRSPYG